MPVRTSRILDRDAALSAWWESPLGRALLAAESELLAEALEDVFGWELLQVGAWGNARDLLAGSRSRRQSLIAAGAFPGMRARWSRSGFPPGMRRVLSERLLREWLVLLGFEVVAAKRYLYLSPWSRGLSRGEGTGRMLRPGLTYPLPAGAFLLKARKRVYTLTPVRQRFREKTTVIGGLVKPTTRSRA